MGKSDLRCNLLAHHPGPSLGCIHVLKKPTRDVEWRHTGKLLKTTQDPDPAPAQISPRMSSRLHLCHIKLFTTKARPLHRKQWACLGRIGTIFRPHFTYYACTHCRFFSRNPLCWRSTEALNAATQKSLETTVRTGPTSAFQPCLQRLVARRRQAMARENLNPKFANAFGQISDLGFAVALEQLCESWHSEHIIGSLWSVPFCWYAWLRKQPRVQLARPSARPPISGMAGTQV